MRYFDNMLLRNGLNTVQRAQYIYSLRITSKYRISGFGKCERALRDPPGGLTQHWGRTGTHLGASGAAGAASRARARRLLASMRWISIDFH